MRLFFAALLLTSATLLSASTLPISDPVGNRVLDPEIPLDALLQAGAWCRCGSRGRNLKPYTLLLIHQYRRVLMKFLNRGGRLLFWLD